MTLSYLILHCFVMTTSQENKSGEFALAELAEKMGYPQRTIRLYIACGLLPLANKVGCGASYGEEHRVKTAVWLFYFIANRRYIRTFRHHVAKMILFLKNHSLTETDEHRKRLIAMEEREIPLPSMLSRFK